MRVLVAVAVALVACGGSQQKPEAQRSAVELPVGSSAPLGSAPSQQKPPGDDELTYEAALALPAPAATGPDLTNAELSAPLHDSRFLDACGVPDSMRVTVRVAVMDGRARGVTVTTSPPDPTTARCVDHAIRAKAWPPSPRMDAITTTY